MARKKEEEITENPAETASTAEETADIPAEAPVKAAAEDSSEAKAEGSTEVPAPKHETAAAGDEKPARKGDRGNRAQKIGIGQSDKMTKTAWCGSTVWSSIRNTASYVRSRNKFMAHNEMGAKIGDKVRIVETRPLSAHKRWRVVEIIQKAEK